MNKALDSLTSGVRRAVDLLFVLNPIGSSLGAFAGVVASGITKLFAPALVRYRDLLDVTSLNVFYFVASGIFLFNLPRLFAGRRPLPQEVEDAFEGLRRLRATGELSEMQLRMHYLALCSEIIARASIDPSKLGPSQRA